MNTKWKWWQLPTETKRHSKNDWCDLISTKLEKKLSITLFIYGIDSVFLPTHTSTNCVLMVLAFTTQSDKRWYSRQYATRLFSILKRVEHTFQASFYRRTFGKQFNFLWKSTSMQTKYEHDVPYAQTVKTWIKNSMEFHRALFSF